MHEIYFRFQSFQAPFFHNYFIGSREGTIKQPPFLIFFYTILSLKEMNFRKTDFIKSSDCTNDPDTGQKDQEIQKMLFLL